MKTANKTKYYVEYFIKYNTIFLKRNYEIKLGPLNFSPLEPSRLESPRAIWAKPVRRGITRWRVRVWLCPLWFHQVCPWCLLCLSPLSVSVLCSPAEVNLRTVWRRQLLYITTPWRQPDLVASSTVVNGLSFGGSSLTLFKGFGPRMEPPESFIRGLGNPGSSLLSWLGLSPANLLYREDFPQSIHLG